MMSLKKENLKTLLLLLLILMSLLQIGIHWYQQAQGFPFRFIEEIFNLNRDQFPSMDVDSIKHRYFVPESIIVSVSSTASLWKLEKNDPYFTSIWNDVKVNYFPAMIKEKPTKIIPKDQWSAIISGRCIRIDFAVNWPNDIIFWLKDVKKPRDFKGFNGVRSIAILPQSDVNETVNTVFVYDENHVYQYQINIKNDHFLPKAFYSSLADELNFRNSPRLSVLSANTPYVSDRDILVFLDRGINKAYSSLMFGIPPAIELNKANISNDSIQDRILLNQKESLMAKHNDEFTEVWFTDTDNLYTLNSDGVLQYRYMPMLDKEAGTATDALRQALSFIELRRSLLGDVELVLTKIERVDYYYEMKFEYQLNGVPIYYSGADSESRISSPLTIKANSKRVLECQWVIRSFQSTAESKPYSLNFTDLVETQILSLYPEILKRESKYFEKIETCYVFGLKDKAQIQKPQWIISTDLKDYFIPLMAEEG